MLAGKLIATDRGAWLDEEMGVLTAPETYQADPGKAWRRLSGRMRKPREIAVLMEVAAWREREAQTRNVPGLGLPKLKRLTVIRCLRSSCFAAGPLRRGP